MNHAPLFLCLDLVPKPGAAMPPGETIAELLAHPDTSTDNWFREWRVFTDLEAARTHAASHPTVVWMPLVIEPNAMLEETQ